MKKVQNRFFPIFHYKYETIKSEYNILQLKLQQSREISSNLILRNTERPIQNYDQTYKDLEILIFFCS